MRLRRAMIRYFLGDCPQMGYSNISRNRLWGCEPHRDTVKWIWKSETDRTWRRIELLLQNVNLQFQWAVTERNQVVSQIPGTWSIKKATAESGVSKHCGNTHRILPEGEKKKGRPLSGAVTQSAESPVFWTQVQVCETVQNRLLFCVIFRIAT
jgi:hypothetical protein